MKLAKLLSILVFFGGISALGADNTAPTTTPVSPGDMAVKAAGVKVQIEEDSQKLIGLRDKARKLKDVIKLSCVNDKLVQAKAQQNIADTADADLQGALQKNSEATVAYNQLIDAGNSIHRLREEAAACVGQGELTKQEVGNTVNRPIIRDDPDTLEPFAPDSGLQGGNVAEPPYTVSGDGS